MPRLRRERPVWSEGRVPSEGHAAQRSTENSRIAGMKLSFECPGRVNLNNANLCSGVNAAHCSRVGDATPRLRAQTHIRSGTTAASAQGGEASTGIGSTEVFVNFWMREIKYCLYDSICGNSSQGFSTSCRRSSAGNLFHCFNESLIPV